MHCCICMWLMCLRITTCDCNTRIFYRLNSHCLTDLRALQEHFLLQNSHPSTLGKKTVSAICKLIVAFTDGLV